MNINEGMEIDTGEFMLWSREGVIEKAIEKVKPKSNKVKHFFVNNKDDRKYAMVFDSGEVARVNLGDAPIEDPEGSMWVNF